MKDPLADACIPCPAGYYCVNDKSLDPERCPNGYYCPIRTGFNWRSCPKGTYDDRGGLANVTCTQISLFFSIDKHLINLGYIKLEILLAVFFSLSSMWYRQVLCLS